MKDEHDEPEIAIPSQNRGVVTHGHQNEFQPMSRNARSNQ